MTDSPPTPGSPSSSSLRTLIDETEALPDDLFEALQQRVEDLFLTGLQRPEAEVCVVLIDDPGIHDLNHRWRGVDAPTDVLSFPMQEGFGATVAGVELLGDVVVSVDTATRQAVEGQHDRRLAEALGEENPRWTLLDELTFLIVHGVLHLLGHDHAEPEEEAVMRAEEARLFALICGRRS